MGKPFTLVYNPHAQRFLFAILSKTVVMVLDDGDTALTILAADNFINVP